MPVNWLDKAAGTSAPGLSAHYLHGRCAALSTYKAKQAVNVYKAGQFHRLLMTAPAAEGPAHLVVCWR